MALEIVFAG